MDEPSEVGIRRALFLDRDGVINEEVGYLHRQEDVRFVPGIFSLCRMAQALGYDVVVVTNQAGIARGYYTEEDFHRLMGWMRAEFVREGASLDAVYYCPFHPEHGIGEYKRDHEDRKPRAGMLRRAEAELGVSTAESVMVGDRCTDVAAANAGGVRKMFLLAGTESHCAGEYEAVESLAQVERWIAEQG